MSEYIEREALMRRIKEIHCAECDSYHGVRCRACWVDDTLDYIDSEPAADVAPVVHGRWLPFRVGFWTSVFECSECHRRVTLSCDEVRTFEMLNRRYPFCHCGAKMDLEE